MGVYTLYLDSRSRQFSSTVAEPVFVLPKSILNVKEVIIQSFSFSNTIYNIDKNNNTIIINNINYYIPSKFYTPDDMVSLLSSYGLSTVYDSSKNMLQWSLGTTTLSCVGGSADVFGLIENFEYSGNIEKPLTLASPCAIQLTSPSLTSHINQNPLLICPVTTGHNEMQTYELPYKNSKNMEARVLDFIKFRLSDARTGRTLNEVHLWSTIIILQTSDI